MLDNGLIRNLNNGTLLRSTLAFGFGLLGALGSVADDTYETDIFPLVQKYCFDCHNNDRMRGDLNLARFEKMGMVLDSIAIWQRAGKRIESKEMPPRSRQVQPTDEERAKILKWIESLKLDDDDCHRIASEETVSWYPGYVMSRRLNRAEYENTVRDLFGVEIDVAGIFPADGAGGEGFDNNGNALFLSAIQVEKYLEAADLVVESVLPRKKASLFASFRSKNAPEHRSEPESARKRLIPIEPGRNLRPKEAARQVLEQFLMRAWRRPVEPPEVNRLVAVFEQAHKKGDSYDSALKMAFKAALVSPNFLFLAEPQPAERGTYELGDYTLASRLSYFLWASMPDEELFEVAKAGELRDEEMLRHQIRRMLKDEKASGLGKQFALQWLGINQLGETTRPDAERFPEFDEAMAVVMQAEPALYFTRLCAEDRSLLELIDSDYTIANERLASIYGLDGVAGEDMRVVQLDDPNRGGVLGMAAVLTATSHPLRTSPVLRGKWVLEQLLGDHVPPPPPGVEQLPEDDVQPDGLSLRARLEAHRKNPDCASCHDRMDPIGFGLENFDPIGRWRDEQAGQPVDAKGVLPSGEAFTGPQELKSILLKRKNDFARNLSRKMLGYALGRSLTHFDNCVVDDCVKALEANDYRPSALFETIVLSHGFRHRYSGGESEQGSSNEQ